MRFLGNVNAGRGLALSRENVSFLKRPVNSYGALVSVFGVSYLLLNSDVDCFRVEH